MVRLSLGFGHLSINKCKWNATRSRKDMFNFRCTKRMDRLKGFGFEASKLLKNGCEMGLRLIYFGSLKAGSFFVLGLLAF